jgi:hypothetical protein
MAQSAYRPTSTSGAGNRRQHQRLRHAICTPMASEEHLEGARTMPKKEHVKDVGPNEQKMYEHIVDEAKKDDRYGKRAEEVAARTVLKHHREAHHDKGE